MKSVHTFADNPLIVNRCVSFLITLILTYPLSAQLKYPSTAKVNESDNYHGTVISDPYRWLENDTGADTRNWVSDQSKLTEAYLEGIPFRHEIRKRIATFYNYTRYGSPFRNGNWYYYYKNDGLQDYSVLYRQAGLDGTPEVVIDPNKWLPEGELQLVDFVPSRNGKYAAVVVSQSGSDWQTIYIKDMGTMQNLADTVKWLKVSDVAWEGDGFYYSRYPEPEKGKELSSQNQDQQLYYHKVGTSQDNDELIFRDSLNPFRFYYASTSEDERYVFMSIVDRGRKGFSGNALWYRDNHDSIKTFKPIVAEPGEYVYGVIDRLANNKFLIQTNDGAPNSKVILFDPKKPAKEKWKTVVAEKNDPLEIATLSGGQLFTKYLRNTASKIYVYTTTGKLIRELKLPGPGDAEIYHGQQDDTVVFYTYRSLNYPTHIFQYHLSTGISTIFRKPDIIFNPDDYVTTQKFFVSRDGTRVPMFMVHKKGIKRDGKNPTLLYGYGGFNYSVGLAFNTSVMPWLEQGGIYAIVSLRGGGEFGEEWHKAGMLHNKQRVFDDFIAAAEYMISRKYTSASLLAARGASNGGLLVGAVANQRPNLFKVIIPEVGVMDMLRFHRFTIGWNWISEYGTSENENDFRNLLSYSPLHNIKEGVEYPATMVVTADHDDRVVPAHSYKYVATLQEKSINNKNPVILKVQTNSGHGISSIMKNIELAADIFSFVLYNMNVQWNSTHYLNSGK